MWGPGGIASQEAKATARLYATAPAMTAAAAGAAATEEVRPLDPSLLATTQPVEMATQEVVPGPAQSVTAMPPPAPQ
eukprot:5301858-Pyramimonas_sp.AAC.1